MDASAWLLPRPRYEITTGSQAAFEALWATINGGDLIDYWLPQPKWQFLTYLCAAKDLVLHGSQRGDIRVVEPRQANDTRAYSNQRAIYATTDGIWVIYYAILDRQNHPAMSLFTSCLQARQPAGQFGEPLYFFSVSQAALLQKPWGEGTVYILSRASFEHEAPHRVGDTEVSFPHWISRTAVEPAARLSVGPEDFPFLAQIHGHDDGKLAQMAAADPSGFPWPEALES